MPVDIIEQTNQIGWFLPILALVLPLSILLFFAQASVLTTLMVCGQLAAIYFALGAVLAHHRRSRYTSFQMKMLLGPFYLIACFATNVVVFLAVGIAHRFF